MADFDWLNLVFSPVAVVFICVLLGRYLMGRRIGEKSNSSIGFLIDFFAFLRKGIRLEYDSFSRTILFPIIASGLVFLILVFIPVESRVFQREPLADQVMGPISSVIIAPIWEEIFARGVIFGCLLLGLAQFIRISHEKKQVTELFKENGKLSWQWIWMLLILQGLAFSWAHSDNNNYLLVVKSASGILNGAIFYFSRKNLLPAIVAHSTWNIGVFLLQTSLI